MYYLVMGYFLIGMNYLLLNLHRDINVEKDFSIKYFFCYLFAVLIWPVCVCFEIEKFFTVEKINKILTKNIF